MIQNEMRSGEKHRMLDEYAESERTAARINAAVGKLGLGIENEIDLLLERFLLDEAKMVR